MQYGDRLEMYTDGMTDREKTMAGAKKIAMILDKKAQAVENLRKITGKNDSICR